jgi:hypothetical protein
MKLNKYHAIRRRVGGFVFDSLKEANRYRYLIILQSQGKITELDRQVRYTILDPYILNGKKVRGITYVADFVYKIQGKIHVEDVKGFRTPAFILKKKMFESKYHTPIEEV